MAKVVDIASDIWKLELDEPEEISVASIAQWLRTKIGDLNNLINQGFYINDSYEIIDENGVEINEDAVSIFKKLYEIYYFKRQSKNYLGAGGVDSISQVTQDGITVRGIDRNNIAKSYNDLYKEAKNELKVLLNNYKYNRISPTDVVGDDYLSENPPLIVNPINNASTYDGY